MEKWSEYQEYIQPETIREEENFNSFLILYYCFCTLTWENQYFLVCNDNILLISEEPLYNDFELAKDVCGIFADVAENYKDKIYKEIDSAIVKDTYSKGKNAGLRKAKIIFEELFEK